MNEIEVMSYGTYIIKNFDFLWELMQSSQRIILLSNIDDIAKHDMFLNDIDGTFEY